MVIIHGDNTALSRKKLQEIISDYQKKEISIIRLEAKKLTVSEVEEQLGASSLFGEDKSIIIEGLHSLPTSKRKKALIAYLSSVDEATTPEICLYETRPLTKSMLKKFTAAKTFEYKITNALWKLLDNISSGNKKATLLLLREAIEQNDVYFVYTMIIRQIRLLIQAKEKGKIKLAPFMVSKLQKQARDLSLNQLLSAHTQLHILDIKQKNSRLILDLEQELDLLLFRL